MALSPWGLALYLLAISYIYAPLHPAYAASGEVIDGLWTAGGGKGLAYRGECLPAGLAQCLGGLAEGGDEFGNPEGTVWIGVTGPAGTVTRKYWCDLGRKANIRRFANVALQFLKNYIESDIK